MNSVEEHYSAPGLWLRVREALKRSGLDPDHLRQADIEKLDQFHVGGLEATNQLAAAANIQASDRVLDLGSGIGGPSRHLAASVGCRVTGLDLTREYCEVATALAQSTGLAHLVDYQQGDALHSPFENESFNVVWTQHASMNIEDKPALYREIFRVLAPNGRLVLHDIVAGSGPVHYPVPWARDPEFSFLITEPDLKNALKDAGFRIESSIDQTKEGLEFLRQAASRPPSSGFGLATLLGPEFPSMIANLVANLDIGACRILQVVSVK
jgi:ubiquinone/menaquinone biosynthesis C-methylase UbiE